MDENVTDLFHAAAGGGEDAWSSLVERYLPLVRSVIRSYGLSGENAEDVSQTLWLRLVEHLKDIREPRALPGWIKTTTRNECMQLLKAARRAVPVGASVDPHVLPDVDRELDEDLLRAERHQALLQALAELPDHQRNLLILLAVDPPLSYEEIARRLDIPKGSIGPTRARALQRLREHHAIATMLDTTTEDTDDQTTARRRQ
ncbi:MAG: RNA polymerase sigma factor [Pseudonocardiaceae bacterium]